KGLMRWALAIDFGGTHIKGAVVSETGAIACESTRPSLIPEGSASVLKRMGELILHLKETSKKPVAGVGIGCPGPLSIKTGTVFGSPNLTGWKEVPIVRILEAQIKMPVFLDNDANCAALGECTYGVGKGHSSLVMLTFGTGIGGGVIVDGK